MASASSEPPRARRRWVRHAVAAALAILAVEGSAYALHWNRTGAPPSWSALAHERGALTSATEGRDTLPRADLPFSLEKTVAHPYLGFVIDPRVETWLTEHAVAVHGADDRPPRPSAERAVVGVFGGSVAFELANDHADALRRALAPAFGGREVVLVVAATPGAKQPQMLNALSWLLIEGYRFDAVIELNGYNEIGNAAGNQRWFGVHPAYPYQYRGLMASAYEGPAYLAAVGELTVLTSERRARAAWMDGSWLRFSATANLLWRLRDDSALVEMEGRRLALAHLASDEVHHYGPRGPPIASEPVAYDELAAVWQRSNGAMAAIARAAGARFVVCLQPNQYLPGEKPMSAWERAHTLEYAALREAVPRGYAELRPRGLALEAGGVPFEDLGRVFADHEETLYRDNCCHLNEPGYELLAAAIGARMVAREAARAGGALSDAAPGNAAPGNATPPVQEASE